MTRSLLIFGTGTLAELAAYYFRNDSDYEVCGFTDHAEFLNQPDLATKLGSPVIEWSEALRRFSTTDVEVFVAIGYRKTNSVREQRYSEVKQAGYHCASYVSSKAIRFCSSIGDNCFILESNVLQPFAQIGNNVTMWSGNHLGHHSVIEDHCFVTSHVVISGKCRIGSNSFLGVNCCLRDGVTLGAKTVVGAGATVLKDCEPRSVFAPVVTEARVVNRDII